MSVFLTAIAMTRRRYYEYVRAVCVLGAESTSCEQLRNKAFHFKSRTVHQFGLDSWLYLSTSLPLRTLMATCTLVLPPSQLRHLLEQRHHLGMAFVRCHLEGGLAPTPPTCTASFGSGGVVSPAR